MLPHGAVVSFGPPPAFSAPPPARESSSHGLSGTRKYRGSSIGSLHPYELFQVLFLWTLPLEAKRCRQRTKSVRWQAALVPTPHHTKPFRYDAIASCAKPVPISYLTRTIPVSFPSVGQLYVSYQVLYDIICTTYTGTVCQVPVPGTR